MPTYDYECKKCKKQFEIQRGFHEEGDVSCPECGGKGQRIYSVPPLIFKGSGFYVTDHKKKDDKATDREPSAKTEAEKPAKKDEAAKAETKPSTDKPSPKTDAAKPAPKPQPDKS